MILKNLLLHGPLGIAIWTIALSLSLACEAGAAGRAPGRNACTIRASVPVTVTSRGRKIKTSKVDQEAITFPTSRGQEHVITRQGT